VGEWKFGVLSQEGMKSKVNFWLDVSKIGVEIE
jgi:hypothetical protein